MTTIRNVEIKVRPHDAGNGAIARDLLAERNPADAPAESGTYLEPLSGGSVRASPRSPSRKG